MAWHWLLRTLIRRGIESAADGLVKDPLTMSDADMADVEIDMPDYAIEEEMTIAQLGEFCVALAGAVDKGFSLEEGCLLYTSPSPRD